MNTRAHTVPKFLLSGFASPEFSRGCEPFLWIASLETGKISRRSPKNISIARGYYDGAGGFANQAHSIETHLAKIESDAAKAIKRLASRDSGNIAIAPEVWRLLSWQAARTPAWHDLVKQLANESNDDLTVDPPPPGTGPDRDRPLLMQEPNTGERREVHHEEFGRLRKLGWKWIWRRDDRLEATHLQAWYFQVRHFPRFDWVRLDAPDGECFIIGDRGVTWAVDGFVDTPPAALRDPAAQIVAPLTSRIVLVGRHGHRPLIVTPREVNRFTAFASDCWIAGPNRKVIEQAFADRRDPRH